MSDQSSECCLMTERQRTIARCAVGLSEGFGASSAFSRERHGVEMWSRRASASNGFTSTPIEFPPFVTRSQDALPKRKFRVSSAYSVMPTLHRSPGAGSPSLRKIVSGAAYSAQGGSFIHFPLSPPPSSSSSSLCPREQCDMSVVDWWCCALERDAA